MPKRAAGLTVKGVETKPQGFYADGGGLYLKVTPSGTRSWVFRYMSVGKRHDLGLGPWPDISLAEARDRAAAQRQLRLDGKDPATERKAGRVQAALKAAKATTFKAAAEAYIEAHKAGWKNAKHAAQWTATLETYAYPTFGKLPVDSIDTALVVKVLEPIWTKVPETASRVRGRIESILDWATVRGFRKGDNPARWKGHLQALLPARGKVARVEHHAALPYTEMGAFMRDLRSRKGLGAKALEFAILTAARTGEVIGATWSEIDFQAATWTIAAERMKAGREHRVPLSGPALAILKALPKGSPDDRPFKLSNMAMLKLAKDIAGDVDVTGHGFRSTFRDWAAETTAFPSEVAEMALAHVVGDKVEAAYRRGDLFAKRVQLAEAWAKFCGKTEKPSGNVIRIAAMQN